MQQNTIEEVLEMHTPDLMSIPGVVGTGMGLVKEQPCIHVMVEKHDQQMMSRLPQELEGYKVRVVVSGQVFALGE